MRLIIIYLLFIQNKLSFYVSAVLKLLLPSNFHMYRSVLIWSTICLSYFYCLLFWSKINGWFLILLSKLKHVEQTSLIKDPKCFLSLVFNVRSWIWLMYEGICAPTNQYGNKLEVPLHQIISRGGLNVVLWAVLLQLTNKF